MTVRRACSAQASSEVDDCHKTYEDVKKKGVQFAGAPEDRFYGVKQS